MISINLQARFDAWLDEALVQPIPLGVIAFCFNLAEPWSIEVIGSARFDEGDSDWACEESFRPVIENLALPAAEVGATWEAVLEQAKIMILTYLNRPSTGSGILRRADAIAVGFVDGELHTVLRNENA